jgi:serine protease Do
MILLRSIALRATVAALPAFAFCAAAAVCQVHASPQEPGSLPQTQQSAESLSREVKDVFAKCSKAVVKIRGTDNHGKLVGTGFFVEPTGTLYTAFSVGADARELTVEFDGKQFPAREVMSDRRSGLAMLKVDDVTTPSLPIGRSKDLEIATPLVTIGFPLDLPQTPNFGMLAGFDRKFLGRYLSTTHLRVNLPTQRGEAGAPVLNFKGEVVGILMNSIESGACHALPIDAAEKIRNDYVRFGEARHGWVGINVAPAPREVGGSRAQFTDIMPDTPAAESGAKPGDILLQVGNTPVNEPEDVIDASFFITAGDRVPIVVQRGDEKLTFTVEADFHPAAQRERPPKIASPLGLGAP